MEKRQRALEDLVKRLEMCCHGSFSQRVTAK